MPDLVAVAGRLDTVVAGMTGAPRADVQRAIASGLVKVDGRTRPKSLRLAGGETLEVPLRTGPVAGRPAGSGPVRR